MISVLQQTEGSAPPQAIEEQSEVEFVLSRAQVASTMLLVLVLAVVLAAGAYVIGKAAGPKTVVQAAMAVPAPVVQAPAPVAVAAKVVEKTLEKKVEAATVAASPISADSSAPLYAEQQAGKVYLQVGAVEKGLAAIWAEGLRTHGLDAFVAPGPSEKMWRVVIGPLPNPEAFQRAKDMLDQLGITTFGRKQQ